MKTLSLVGLNCLKDDQHRLPTGSNHTYLILHLISLSDFGVTQPGTLIGSARNKCPFSHILFLYMHCSVKIIHCILMK